MWYVCHMRPHGQESVLRGTLSLGTCRSLAFILGFSEIVLLAGKFGTGFETDAYLVARSISLFFLLGIEASLSVTFIPVFVKHMEEAGETVAWKIADTLFLIFLVVFSLVALGIWMGASHITKIVAPGFSAEAVQTTARLTMMMAPLLILMPLINLLSSVHYCYRHFTLPALTSVVGCSGAVIGLLFFVHKIGVYALPLGLIGTQSLQFVLMLCSSRKYRQHAKWHPQLVHPGVKQVLRLMGPRFLAYVLFTSNLMVDRFFASSLGTGYIAALHYADRLIFTPAGMINQSLGKSLMPTFSRCAATNDLEGIDRRACKVMQVLACVCIPLAGFLVLFRVEIIVLLFRRGRFDIFATQSTADALLFYSLGIVGFCLTPVLVGMFFSFQDAITPLKVSAVTAVLNIVLDFFLAKSLGHRGIAMATSMVVTANLLLLWILFRRRFLRLSWEGVAGSLGKCLVSIAVTIFLMQYFHVISNLKVFVDGAVGDLGNLVLKMAFGMLIYLVICRFLKVEIYLQVWGLLLERSGFRKLKRG